MEDYNIINQIVKLFLAERVRTLTKEELNAKCRHEHYY